MLNKTLMKIIDTKGKLCPLPLIMTKKALKEMENQETLKILIDNEISVKNVSRFLEDNGLKFSVVDNAGIFELSVNKTADIPENLNAEDYCSPENIQSGNYVIAVLKNRFGEGSDELGEILVKACINTLPELSLKPRTLVFMNAGIFLTLKDSPVLDALKKLENAGVDMLVCGTCLDYFKKKDELAIGQISNMFVILENITATAKVLYL